MLWLIAFGVALVWVLLAFAAVLQKCENPYRPMD